MEAYPLSTASWNNQATVDWASIQPAGVAPHEAAFQPMKFVGWAANSWQGVFARRAKELGRLQRGWDGYDALPLNNDVIIFAWEMLRGICTQSTPPPSIVPGVDGDLQVEWHTESESVELHVLAPNDVRCWRRKNVDDTEEELQLTHYFNQLDPWIRDLTSTAGAAVATAG